MKRRMNGILSLLLSICLVLGLLPGVIMPAHAEECLEHIMEYWPEGDKDDWDHTLKCFNCGEEEWQQHSYDSIADPDCNVCGYVVECQIPGGHVLENNGYDRDEETHVRKCDGCIRVDETTRENHTDPNGDKLCDGCGVCFGAEHDFAWTEGNGVDRFSHQLLCRRCKLPEYDEWPDHVDENADSQCDVCEYHIIPMKEVALRLKPVDESGSVIDGLLDVRLNEDEWVGSDACGYDPRLVFVGENTLDDWDYCPDGYVRPDAPITFIMDEAGNITVTSDNATVESAGDIVYLVVTLREAGSDDSEEDDDSFAAVSAQYTDIHYEAEGEVVFASGTLQVTADAAGTVTAAWGSGETLVEVTCAVEAGGSAELTFEAVELWDLRVAEITFVPDEDADAATGSHYISDDLVTLDVTAATAYIEEVSGYYLSEVRINGIPASELYLFPGTQVTVELGLLPVDTYLVGELLWSEHGFPAGIADDTEGTFCYENEAEEKEYADVTDDGRGTITFTLPAEKGSRAWLEAFCIHEECVDDDADHRCDSGICGKKTASVDTAGDHICDICGVKMAILNGWESCDLEELLNCAADGNTVTLLGDHAINGKKGWYAAAFFQAEDNAAVTLDLNGFTLSVDEADYLLSVGGSGTLKITDSSEQKTGRLENPDGLGILAVSGGAFDLSSYPHPAGITVYNAQNVPAAVSGHTADPTPIRLILPEGCAVAVEIEGRTVYSKRIPAETVATVVMPPELAPDGEGMVVRNAQVVAEKVLIAGYQNGQLKAAQVVETVTEEIVITDEVLAWESAEGGQLMVFLLDAGYAPVYRVLMREE